MLCEGDGGHRCYVRDNRWHQAAGHRGKIRVLTKTQGWKYLGRVAAGTSGQAAATSLLGDPVSISLYIPHRKKAAVYLDYGVVLKKTQ